MQEPVIKDLPFFKDIEKKEKFIQVIGALVLRLISLRRASEVLEIDESLLLNILDAAGYEFSYLEDDDIIYEKEKLF